MNRYRTRTSLGVVVAFGSLFAMSAQAATPTKVNQSEWQGGVALPSYVNMYIYVPDSLATKPPILVASHHCQGTGMSTYNETKNTFVSQADKNGYIIIFPEATGHNCWDVGSDKSLKHDGGGDTHAVAQMVRYTVTKYSADASRVYAFGGSSGGMMTQALLGVYPDIFKAGVSISGVACGCWAQDYSGDSATNPQWSGPCAGGKVTKSAEEWGNLVRGMFPGYTGRRARVQLWHGDPDGIINFANFGESIKEWTNVLGLPSTPTKTENPSTSTTHQTWNNACGVKALETFAIKGADHSVQWDLATASAFLGLDKKDGQDPEAGCGGTGGAGGAGGTGSTSTGGQSTATGGRTGLGGSSATGGTVSTTGGTVSTTGGTVSTTGGTAATTGGTAATTGGTAATTGGSTTSPATGGALVGSGGSGTGGAAATGGALASGGSLPGSSAAGGQSPSGGSVATSGTTTSAGTDATSAGDEEGDEGCGCSVPGERNSGTGWSIAAVALGALLLRSRRRS